MEHVIQIDTLLGPIPGDNPGGIDLREERTNEYVDAKEARNNARAAERSAMLDPENAGDLTSDWRQILQIAPQILEEQAKDLEVAVWLLEALVRLHGFTGLRDGVALINGLVEQHWEHLYPLPDEDGLETKVAPLTGINGEGAEGTLVAPLRKLEITAPNTGSGPFDAFSYWHFQQAQEASNIEDEKKRAERHQHLGYSIDTINQAVAASPDAYYQQLVSELESTIADYEQLHDQLYDECGVDSPPSGNLKDIFEELNRAVRFLAKDKVLEAEVPATVVESSDAPARSSVQQAPVSGAALDSRAAALQQLSEVARFFRATEPHTPIADGIDRIIRWGNMPISLLMQELMPDANSRAMYTLLTGVQVGSAPEQADMSNVDVEAASASVTPVSQSEVSTTNDYYDSQQDQDSGW